MRTREELEKDRNPTGPYRKASYEEQILEVLLDIRDLLSQQKPTVSAKEEALEIKYFQDPLRGIRESKN